MVITPIATPVLKITTEQDATHFVLSGDIVVLSLDSVQKEMQQAKEAVTRKIIFDLQKVANFDTAGSVFLLQITKHLQKQGKTVSFVIANENHAKLLEHISGLEYTSVVKENKVPSFVIALNNWGEAAFTIFFEVRDMIGFWGMVLSRLGYSLLRPHKIRWIAVFAQIEQVGVNAVPIVTLLTFLIGLVVAYMGGTQFIRFGMTELLVAMVEAVSFRELAIILTAIIVAGRSGSSFTAQIGSMVANEEVAALSTIGLNYLDVLVIPRVLGVLITLPLLCILADVASVFGGMVATWLSMDMTPTQYLQQFYQIAKIQNFVVGLVKAPFFALVIAVIGCFQGLRVTGSADSVGRLTTTSVVQSIFFVILIDAIFAIFFMSIGV